MRECNLECGVRSAECGVRETVLGIVLISVGSRLK